MKKTILSGILVLLTAASALYAMQTESAPIPQLAENTMDIELPVSPSTTFPPPHEPLDRTEITPYETVGASHFLPF